MNSKNCNNGHRQEQHCRNNRSRRGPSSFHMQDSSLVFEKLALKQGDTLLDLGCGAGDYSIHAAGIVGETGNIYALDLWQEMLDKICEDAMTQGIHNIHPVVSDIRKKINLSNDSMDICLIATVLHMMDFKTETDSLFAEVKRVLKSGGKLAVIECKKENSSFGPPIQARISPNELEKGLVKFGFSKTDYIDLGSNYMVIFALSQ
ncbi:class I SAM-dependent methyltransferase [Oscillospiraceae bacterium LTW-04]|nr:class I SAM-dependent methyltransferase [Oscillospiraceae bacterium MB24-C1]